MTLDSDTLASAWGDGYLQGWRAAMTEAKGGDWSKCYPVEWWPKCTCIGPGERLQAAHYADCPEANSGTEPPSNPLDKP